MTHPGSVLLLLLPAFALAILLHELGHVVFGAAAGFVVTSFGLGTARPLLVVRLGSVRGYLGLVRPLQGITFVFLPRMQPSRVRLIGFVLGGIIANAVGAVVSLALVRWLPGTAPFWIAFAATNAVAGSTSLLPLNVRAGKTPLRTDGALAIQVLRSGSLSSSPPNIIQTLSTLRGLWTSIGDTRIIRVYTLSAASAWTELGSLERAQAFLLEARTMPGESHPYFDCLAAVIEAMIAITKGAPAEARPALETAENYYRDTRQPAGLYLVNLLRAAARVHEGDAPQAAAELAALAADPIVKAHSDLGMSRLAVQINVACSQADRPAVEDHLAHFEAARRHCPSATRDLQVYHNIARFRSSQAESGEHDFRRALSALKTLANQWSDPDDRSAFLAAQSALIEEARQCLPVEEVDRFLESVTPAAQTEAQATRDRRFRRLGLRAMLVNAAAVGFTVLIATITDATPIPLFLFLGVLLTLFTVIGLLVLALDYTAGRFLPNLSRYTGIILLLLAGYPWVCITFIAVFTMIAPG